MTLLPEYFEKIKKGEKRYEVRLNKNKYKDIKINDFITFNKKPDLIEFIETKVDDILYFTTFNEMVNSLSKYLLDLKIIQKMKLLMYIKKYILMIKKKKNLEL